VKREKPKSEEKALVLRAGGEGSKTDGAITVRCPGKDSADKYSPEGSGKEGPIHRVSKQKEGNPEENLFGKGSWKIGGEWKRNLEKTMEKNTADNCSRVLRLN